MSTLLAWTIMNRGKGTTHCRRVALERAGTEVQRGRDRLFEV
jgi:hypothetical protein